MLKTNEQSNTDAENICQHGKGSCMRMNESGWLRLTQMRNLSKGVMMTNTSEATSATQSGRIQHAWLHQLFKMLLIFLLGTSMASCAEDTRSWQEEVKLLDGRVIIVTIKYGFPRGVFRESWVTLKLPETDNQETTWHEHLQPENLNVVNGKLYIVGVPMTDVELKLYGIPRPPYVGYVFEHNGWRRIPFKEIPEAMYDMNLSSYGVDPKNPRLATLAEKNKLLTDPRRAKEFVRIDPSHIDSSDEFLRSCKNCQ